MATEIPAEAPGGMFGIFETAGFSLVEPSLSPPFDTNLT
jgi:hypothetical protein